MTTILLVVAAVVWVSVAAQGFYAKRGPIVSIGGGLLVAVVVLTIGGLAVNAVKDAVMSPDLTADSIIQGDIKTPATYHRVSSEQVWSGKTAAGFPAYVMKVQFDAQNEFGAVIRNRWLVAFHDEGTRSVWWSRISVQDCDGASPSDERELINEMVEDNFRRR